MTAKTTENEGAIYIGEVTIDFVDENASWRESGFLYYVETNRNNPKHYFLLKNKAGTRVFPLSHRRAEIYFKNSDVIEPFIVEHDYNMSDWEKDLAAFLKGANNG